MNLFFIVKSSKLGSVEVKCVVEEEHVVNVGLVQSRDFASRDRREQKLNFSLISDAKKNIIPVRICSTEKYY